MNQYNRNAAYDLSKIKNKQRSKIIDINRTKAKRVRDFRLKFTAGLYVLSLSLFVLTGVCLFLFGQVKLAELTAKITEVSEQINEAEIKFSAPVMENHISESSGKKSEIYIPAECDKAEIFNN